MFTKFISKLLPHPVLTLTLWIIWLLLNNTIAAGHILLGLIISILIPFFTSAFWPEKVHIRAPKVLLKLIATVMWDILISNITVAKLILGKNETLNPAFFYIELDIHNPLGISILANTISLTPGTVSCDLTADQKRLLVHALHAQDIPDIIKHIKQRYEAPLIKVFISC